MKFELPNRTQGYAQLALVALLAAGCWLVLDPFLPAILFSTAIAISVWPAHLRLLHALRGYRGAASLLSCLGVLLLFVAPAGLLTLSFRDGAVWLLGLLNRWREAGPQLPAWVAHLPAIGPALEAWWHGLSPGADGFDQVLALLAEPARRVALASGRALGNGVLQVLLAALLLFLLFRDGEVVAGRVQALARSLGGEYLEKLLGTARRTVTGIMLSVIGAALAQGTVATLGFYFAGIPNPFLLGALTFALSVLPVGPPLIWGGAALWLVEQGRPGWALFMALYGFFGISSIDNVLKPFLISRSSSLPFALTLLGVIGGAMAFGVAGVFLGPLLLALAIDLMRHRLELPSGP